MNIVSLFSGCGGLDLGFERAGFNVIWANENDSSIHETYRKNHPKTLLNTSDIRNILAEDIPDCDGIIGGPPCQSWSVGGKGLGINDERGKLVYDYISIVKAKQPKFFVMENVPGMLSPRHIASFNKFLSLFDAIGYSTKYDLIDSSHFQIPQDRLRVFVVGIRKDLPNKYQFPISHFKDYIFLEQAIGDIKSEPIPYIDEVVPLDTRSLKNHDYYSGPFDEKYMSRNRVRRWNEISYTIQAQAKNAPLHPQSPRMLYVSKNKRVFTEDSNADYRRLSVRECARIQTFPDSFIFYYKNIKDGYKMVGNAVPPRLAYHLAKSIVDYFDLIISKKSEINGALVGYLKNPAQLTIVRQSNIYYFRRGLRPGAINIKDMKRPIHWLVLHHQGNKYLFELLDGKIEPCNGNFLRSKGFSPNGNEYWFLRLKNEITESSLINKVNCRITQLSKKPKFYYW